MAVSVGGGKRKRNRAKRKNAENSTRVSRRELALTVKMQADGTYAKALSLNPSSACLPWLSGLLKSFEQLVWHRMNISWVPQVATTSAGSVAIGVDWASKLSDTDATRAKVAALTPVLDVPLWQRGSLTVPPQRLQSRRFYTTDTSDPYDSCPGSLLVNVTKNADLASKPVGEIWIDYSVSLYGTKSA